LCRRRIQFDFVCTVSAFEVDRAINCSTVVHAAIGSSVSLHCNLSCLTDNFTYWYWYQWYESEKVRAKEVVHNGLFPNRSWLSRGVSVSYDQKAAHSVLKINEVMHNHTGIYECAGSTDGRNSCDMRFCLSAGENLPFYTICCTVAAPGRQGSQVISRSLRS